MRIEYSYFNGNIEANMERLVNTNKATYVVDCVGLVRDLSVAALSKGLVHLCSVASIVALHWNRNRVDRLLDLSVAECVPILTSASKSVLALVELVLVLVDLHLVGPYCPLVPHVVFTVANHNCSEREQKK